MGGSRGKPVADFLADLGLRLAVGNPDFAVAFELLYTPGPETAENYSHMVYAAYRATATLLFGRFGIGLSWHEVGRGVDVTEQSLELQLSWGFAR